MTVQLMELRTTIEQWRRETRELTYEINHALDIEWLNGRMSALAEVLAYLEGSTMRSDLRERLLGND